MTLMTIIFSKIFLLKDLSCMNGKQVERLMNGQNKIKVSTSHKKSQLKSGQIYDGSNLTCMIIKNDKILYF